MISLETNICGIKLKNPTVLASGILGVTASSLKRVADSGAGAVTTKSIGPEKRRGHKNPVVVEVSHGLLNAIGLPTPGPEEAIEELKRQLPLKKALILKAKEAELVKKIIPLFEHPYRESVEKLAPLINALSHQFPKRRERMQHIGLFGYSRGVGSAKLPRAIPFTGILYSIGLPPEIIGTGRGIRAAKNKKYWQEISHLYKYFKDDIVRAGYFLNKANLEKISKQADIWKEIKEDIKAIEESLQVELGPKNKFHKEHRDLTKRIWTAFNSGKKYSNLITGVGILRNSLG